MYCSSCGEKNEENAQICTNCGAALSSSTHSEPEQSKEPFQPEPMQEEKSAQQPVQDKANIGINIITFCFMPLLGIIMYFVWKGEKPIAAKSALMWGLIAIGVWIVFYIIIGILVGIAGSIDPTTDF